MAFCAIGRSSAAGISKRLPASVTGPVADPCTTSGGQRLPVDAKLLRVRVAVAFGRRPAPFEHDRVRARAEQRPVGGGQVGIELLEDARPHTGRDHRVGVARGAGRLRRRLALFEPDDRPVARARRAPAERVEREDPVLVQAAGRRPVAVGLDEHVVERHERRHRCLGGLVLREGELEVGARAERWRIGGGAARAERERAHVLAVDRLELLAGVDAPALDAEAERLERRGGAGVGRPRDGTGRSGRAAVASSAARSRARRAAPTCRAAPAAGG